MAGIHVQEMRVFGACTALSLAPCGCRLMTGSKVWWRNPSGDRGKYGEQGSGDYVVEWFPRCRDDDGCGGAQRGPAAFESALGQELCAGFAREMLPINFWLFVAFVVIFECSDWDTCPVYLCPFG